jgi:hypothetical protein
MLCAVAKRDFLKGKGIFIVNLTLALRYGTRHELLYAFSKACAVVTKGVGVMKYQYTVSCAVCA